jgi:hypothetical protein
MEVRLRVDGKVDLTDENGKIVETLYTQNQIKKMIYGLLGALNLESSDVPILRLDIASRFLNTIFINSQVKEELLKMPYIEHKDNIIDGYFDLCYKYADRFIEKSLQ